MVMAWLLGLKTHQQEEKYIVDWDSMTLKRENYDKFMIIFLMLSYLLNQVQIFLSYDEKTNRVGD